VPALATLALAARLPPPVALTGAAGLAMVAALRPGRTALTRAAPARARIPAPALGAPLFVAVGAAWAALVAAMSEAGFSGEARYLLPGAVLLTVGGSSGVFLLGGLLAARRRGRVVRTVTAVAVAATLALTAAARADDLAGGARRVAYGAALAADLERAVARAGGPARLRGCGPPYPGRYRGPLVAWALGVPKRAVGFTRVRPGVAFRSRLHPGGPVSPAPPPGGPLGVRVPAGLWSIAGGCRDAPGERRPRSLGYPNP